MYRSSGESVVIKTNTKPPYTVIVTCANSTCVPDRTTSERKQLFESVFYSDWW